MFGYNTQGFSSEEIELDEDLIEMQICVDDYVHGFRFLQYGSSDYIEITSECRSNIWHTIDLSGNVRLVGFEVVTSDYSWNDNSRQNVRSICPLIETIDCKFTEFILD